MTLTLDDPFTVPTTHWHRLDDGRVQCDVCPRACRLHEGQRGLCFVRARVDDQIVLTSYGRSSGFCVDPVEKKPLNHFLPGSAVLSFGTAGCNLACKFCQNWDISKSREIDTLAGGATPQAVARTADELGCRSVAFTYNDPTIFWEYAADVADACHAARHQVGLGDRGLHVSAAAHRVLSPHRCRQRGSQGVYRRVLPPGLRRASQRRPRHPCLPATRDNRVVRNHHAVDPRSQRRRRRNHRGVPSGSASSWAPMCRCTSRLSTPTTR